jgi:hypothetical protein
MTKPESDIIDATDGQDIEDLDEESGGWFGGIVDGSATIVLSTYFALTPGISRSRRCGHLASPPYRSLARVIHPISRMEIAARSFPHAERRVPGTEDE